MMKAKPKFTKEYFIKKFSKIPAKKWCEGMFSDNQGRHCVMGHCGVKSMFCVDIAPEAVALAALFKQDARSYDTVPGYGKIVGINNECDDDFKQHTPKARVLAALRSLP